MAEMFRRKVPQGSIRRSLSEMRGDLLPPEIRDDSLAAWVMDFDDLRTRPSEARSDSRDRDVWALDLVVTSTLQQQIPFYFASLFHIGRQWKVSERAGGDLAQASTGKHLQMSTQITFAHLRGRNKRLAAMFVEEPEVAREALSFLLESSSREHATGLQSSRGWWAAWRDEVGRLHQQVDRLQDLARQDVDYRLWREIATFVAQAYRPSQLRISMEVAGITFPQQREADKLRLGTVYADVLWPVLLIAMSQGKFRDPFAHELMFELRHVFHDIKQEIEVGESRRIALVRLGKKYTQGEDPFESFLPLRKPASDELRNLILEHTLPGYGDQQYSPWLATWKRCVEYNSGSAVKVTPKDLSTKEAADAFARSADCAIKDALPDEFLPGEAWNDMMQRLFESAWIAKIADQIVSTNAKHSDDGWTFESFATMVRKVATVLNDRGYRLAAPSENRLKRLWERLHSDKRWSDEEW
jgi:hypothetical protein